MNEPFSVRLGTSEVPNRTEKPRPDVVFGLVDPTGASARAAMSAYFAELDARFTDGFDAEDTAAELDAMDSPGGAFVVMLDGEVAVGCGGVRRFDDQTGEIKRMWLDASMRGRGLGRRLLDELEQQVRRLGYTRVVLDTNAVLTEAISMYERAGYVAIERYNNNPHAQCWFAKSLT